MILDSFTNREFARVRKMLEKIATRNREATIAAMLCVTYDSFHKMQLNRICAQNKMSYQEAERQSEECSDAFGVEIPTEAFLPDEEKYSNEAIEYYKEYMENRKLLTHMGYSVDDVEAFCQMVFHNPERYDLCHFRAFNSVGYAVAMVAVYDYLCGTINETQLRMSMQIYELDGMKPMNDMHIRAFVKTMYRVVDAFCDIVIIRAERDEAKCC